MRLQRTTLWCDFWWPYKLTATLRGKPLPLGDGVRGRRDGLRSDTGFEVVE